MTVPITPAGPTRAGDDPPPTRNVAAAAGGLAGPSWSHFGPDGSDFSPAEDDTAVPIGESLAWEDDTARPAGASLAWAGVLTAAIHPLCFFFTLGVLFPVTGWAGFWFWEQHRGLSAWWEGEFILLGVVCLSALLAGTAHRALGTDPPLRAQRILAGVLASLGWLYLVELVAGTVIVMIGSPSFGWFVGGLVYALVNLPAPLLAQRAWRRTRT
jgi:hypothetical protein